MGSLIFDFNIGCLGILGSGWVKCFIQKRC